MSDPDKTQPKMHTAARIITRKGMNDLLNSLKIECATERQKAIEQMVTLGAHMVPTLIQAIRSSNCLIRQGVIEVLGRLKIARALPHFIKALDDPIDDVKLAALIAVKGFDSPQAIEPLIHKFCDENPRIREVAIEAIVDVGAVAIPALVAALQNQDIVLCEASITALTKMGKAVEPFLLTELQNNNYAVREAAAEILGNVKSKRAVPYLLQNLHDPESGVKEAAIEGLGEIGDSQANPYLLPLINDPDMGIKREVIQALGKCKCKEAVPYLTYALKTEKDCLLRMVVVDALGKIGDPTVKTDIELCAQVDEDFEVRQIAQDTLEMYKVD